MVTDPPYGVDWSAAYGLFPGDVAYVWHDGVHAAEVASDLESAGFRIRSPGIWAKQHFHIEPGNYNWQHEPYWYAVKEGQSAKWCGDSGRHLNPLGGSREEARGHGPQKPMELMRCPILNKSVRDDAFFDVSQRSF